MIDVSKLPHLQAQIVLLIERRRETGIRVCELYKEIRGDKGNIRRNLAIVLRDGYVVKMVGDISRYCVPIGAPARPSDTENGGQLTNCFKQTKLTNKKKKKEEPIIESPPAPTSAPVSPPTPTATTTATAAKTMTQNTKTTPHTTPTPHKPNMPSIIIPQQLPSKGSFNGWIFADELPTEKALDRMLEMIQFEAPTQNATFPRYELFKMSEIIIFEDFIRHNKRKVVFDDVVQRIAFAVAMEVPEFRTLDELKQQQKKWKEESKSDFYSWIPALQLLRQIYYFNQWGWNTLLHNTEQTWSFELNRAQKLGEEPRIELFPAKRYEIQLQKQKKNTPKPTTTPQQQPTPPTREQLQADYIEMLRKTPDNEWIRTLLIRNYNLTTDELNKLIKPEELVAV
jgi:hypothetical protein